MVSLSPAESHARDLTDRALHPCQREPNKQLQQFIPGSHALRLLAARKTTLHITSARRQGAVARSSYRSSWLAGCFNRRFQLTSPPRIPHTIAYRFFKPMNFWSGSQPQEWLEDSARQALHSPVETCFCWHRLASVFSFPEDLKSLTKDHRQSGLGTRGLGFSLVLTADPKTTFAKGQV